MNLIIEAPKLPGIYSATNLITGKVYIGSTNNLHKRLNAHRTSLLSGNFISKALQRDYDNLGKSAFVLDIVEIIEGSEYELNERELYFIAEAHKSLGGCYNRVNTVSRKHFIKRTLKSPVAP